MKKFFAMIGVLLSISIQLSAAKEDVPMTIFSSGHDVKNTTVKRMPVYIPISVCYDASTYTIEVDAGENVDAQAFIKSAEGEILDFFTLPNASLSIPSDYSGLIIIRIEAAHWSAEGEIEI